MMRTLALCLFGSALAFAQGQDPTVQALLKEVHELRLALERSSMIGPRIQIVVERMKIQQGAVAALNKQVDDGKRELENFAMGMGQWAARVREIETDLGSQNDPAIRKRLEGELKEMRAQAERAQAMEGSIRSRIADAESRARVEQANLDVLNDKLNQIEKALDRQ